MYEHEEKSQLKSESKKSEKKTLNQPENKNSEFQKELQLKEVAQKKNNTGLPDNLKSGIENLSGYSMDDVKVHYNSNKPAQLNAHAYAQGNQIHLASGQEKHLAHEAWHVVQQKQGRVKPTVNVNGAAVNDSEALEKEADIMGGKALQRKSKDSSVNEASSDDLKIVDNRPEFKDQKNMQLMIQRQSTHDKGCDCIDCYVTTSANEGMIQKKSYESETKTGSNNEKVTQRAVIQRLNSVTAKAASDQAVLDIKNEGYNHNLLAGYGTSTPGHAGHSFSKSTKDAVNAIGDATGCTYCGVKDGGWSTTHVNPSGKTVGNFTPDHEPPNSLVAGGYTGSIKFYPHCKTHTNEQAGVVSKYKSKMKASRNGTDSDWATGVQGSWFWL